MKIYKKINKKGSVMMYLFLIGFIAAMALTLFYAFSTFDEIDYVGKTSTLILSAFEFRERTNTFIDMSMELSTKDAVRNLMDNGGYSSKILGLNKDNYPCGYVNYPVLNDGIEVNKCFPDTAVEFEDEFTPVFERFLGQYSNLLLKPGDFKYTFSENSGNLQVVVRALTEIKVPFLTNPNSYYSDYNSVFETTTFFTADQLQLVDISNIDGAECVHSPDPKPGVTDFGRICFATQALKDQLVQVVENEIKPKGWRITINQAYRDYAIQKSLYNAYGSLACNPDRTSSCPHMTGGAIDVTIFDQNGNSVNKANPALVEEIMCKYGFVRYMKEDWHFEYGTNRWRQAEELRKQGEKACRY